MTIIGLGEIARVSARKGDARNRQRGAQVVGQRHGLDCAGGEDRLRTKAQRGGRDGGLNDIRNGQRHRLRTVGRIVIHIDGCWATISHPETVAQDSPFNLAAFLYLFLRSLTLTTKELE